MDKALKMAKQVLANELNESFLWSYCYENNIQMSEVWNDDDSEIIGFAIEDNVFYY